MTETSPDSPTYVLQQFPEKLAVVKLAIVRLGPGSEIPTWAESSSLFSITATATETSLVCAGRSVPTKIAGVTADPDRLRRQGPLDPNAVGILVALLVPLARGRDQRLHDLHLRHRLAPGAPGGR